jgi:hypothetical protein
MAAGRRRRSPTTWVVRASTTPTHSASTRPSANDLARRRVDASSRVRLRKSPVRRSAERLGRHRLGLRARSEPQRRRPACRTTRTRARRSSTSATSIRGWASSSAAASSGSPAPPRPSAAGSTRWTIRTRSTGTRSGELRLLADLLDPHVVEADLLDLAERGLDGPRSSVREARLASMLLPARTRAAPPPRPGRGERR